MIIFVASSSRLDRPLTLRGPFSVTAIAPERLAPIRRSTEIHRATTVVAPAATQPVPALSIHNRSARQAHARRCWRTGRQRRCRTVGRAVAESDLAGVGAAVEILALDVVLWAAMTTGTAAAVVVSRLVGIRRHASARTRDAAYGVTADVDVWDCRDVGGRSHQC